MDVSQGYEKLLEFLQKYAQYLEEMVAGEQEKLAAILSNDRKRIDHSVAAQQAVAMQMETFEKRRQSIVQEEGFGDLTFREIAGRAPAQLGERFLALFGRMEKAIEEIRYYNDKALDIVELNLQRFGSSPKQPVAAGYGAAVESGKSYHAATLYEKKI